MERIDADDAHDDADGDEGERDVDQRQHRDLGPRGQRPARAHACAPAIIRPSVRSSARPAGTSPVMRPANITTMRSASDRISSSSTETTSTAQPCVAALHQLAMDEFDGADIDAARRLADQQHLGLARHLARQHQLLLVAAGEVRRAQRRRARPHVEAVHQGRRNGGRPPARRAGSCGRTAARPGSPGSPSPRPGTPPPCPGAGGPRAHGRDPASRISAGSLGWRASITRPRTVSLPLVGRRMPDRICSSSVWPLPETPAMPTISPARSSRSTSSSSAHAAMVDQRQLLGRQQHLARLRRAPCRAAAAPCGRPSARPAPRDWSRRCGGRPRSGPGA